MSNAEVGVYIKLLAREWQGVGLPADVRKLAKLVGETLESFAEMWEESLAECFVERDGRLFNERLERERGVSDDFHADKSLRGKYGAALRYKHIPKGTSFEDWKEENAPDGTVLADSSRAIAELQQDHSTSYSSGIAPIPSHPIPSLPIPVVPEGANAPAPPAARPPKSKRVDGKLELTKALAKFPCLDPRVVQTAKFVREYRVKRRQPAFDESDWVKHLAEAQHYPEAFAAAVADMDKFKWLSFHIEKHIGKGQAVAATNGSMPKNLSFRLQDKLIDQHHDDEWDRMVERFEPRHAEIEETR